MRILAPVFCPPGGTWGGLTRVLAVADAARERGHEIAFCASGPLGDRVAQLGYRLYRMPHPTYLGLPGFLSRIIEAKSKDASPPVRPGRSFGNGWLLFFFTGASAIGFLRKQVREQLRALDSYQPDILFTEMDLGCYLASEITGVPVATTYASIFEIGRGTFGWRRVRSSIATILRQHGKNPVEPEELFFGPKTRKLVPSIPELEVNVPETASCVYTGSLFRSFRTESERSFVPEPGKRYVFTYLGTGSVPLKVQREVLPQVFPSGSEHTCLVGAGVAREERHGNVVFRPFWDAETLMPCCEWVICHGGHNTIMQSLANKVPLLVFPGPTFERRFNAAMVEKAGVGLFGERPDFNGAWFAEALRRHVELARRAAAMPDRIRSFGGAARAIQAMESWVRPDATTEVRSG